MLCLRERETRWFQMDLGPSETEGAIPRNSTTTESPSPKERATRLFCRIPNPTERRLSILGCDSTWSPLFLHWPVCGPMLTSATRARWWNTRYLSSLVFPVTNSLSQVGSSSLSQVPPECPDKGYDEESHEKERSVHDLNSARERHLSSESALSCVLVRPSIEHGSLQTRRRSQAASS